MKQFRRNFEFASLTARAEGRERLRPRSPMHPTDVNIGQDLALVPLLSNQACQVRVREQSTRGHAVHVMVIVTLITLVVGKTVVSFVAHVKSADFQDVGALCRGKKIVWDATAQ